MSDDKKSHTWLFFLLFWYMIAILGSVWLQKQQGRKWLRKLFTVCHCKNLLVYFCDCKKEKEKLNQCVIATIWRAWLQTRSYVCCKKTWLCEASPHQRWLNVTQIPVPGGWQHIYYNGWISLLNHGDTEGTEVPTLQGTTQTLTTTLQ
jgi:hypothetical protein